MSKSANHNFRTDSQELQIKSRTEKARKSRPDVECFYLIPVLVKTLNILSLLHQADEPLTVDSIHRRLGYPKSTIYRILRTLSACGYLPEGASGVYKFTKSRLS
jgi:predicted transcriptional regulator